MESRTANSLNIRVHRFFTQADPVKRENGKPTGVVIYRDYVEYGPPGLANMLTVITRIDRISKVSEPDANSSNPVVAMAWNRWKYIEPSYLAWKKGEELPQDGTLLAACSFLRAEDVAVLKQAGVKTVEDLATLLDSNMDKIKLPQMREKRAQAKAFLEAKETNKAAAKMDAQAQEIAELKAQMAAFLESQKDVAEPEAEVDENGDRLPKRKTLKLPERAA